MVRDTWLDQNVPVRARVVRIQVWGFRFGFNISEEGAGVRVQVRLNFLRGFRFGLRIGFGGSVPLRVRVQAGENFQFRLGFEFRFGLGGARNGLDKKQHVNCQADLKPKCQTCLATPMLAKLLPSRHDRLRCPRQRCSEKRHDHHRKLPSHAQTPKPMP